MKAIKLTSHAAAMHLVVQFSCDGVVPRERFGPRSQLFMRASAEQCLETFVAHWQVVENLQHINQNSNWHGEQHNRLQGAHHLEQRD